MDLHERDDLRAFLVALFGNMASGWPMTEQMFNLTYELVSESASCSKAMDYVPRPLPPGREPFKWLTKEVRGVFLRQLKQDKDHYALCLSAAAYRMSTRFQMAAQGV